MSENESGQQTFADYTINKSQERPRIVMVFAIIFILLAVVFGGLYAIGALYKKPRPTPVAPTVTPTITPLPTSSASAVLTPNLTGSLSPRQTRLSPTAGLSTKDKSTNLDRKELQVTVLNGSGEKGAAAQVSTYLEGLGYKIVKVGNAEVFTYKNLTVLVKKNRSAYASLLKKDLQAASNAANANSNYASVSASISDEISSDAEVIVGK